MVLSASKKIRTFAHPHICTSHMDLPEELQERVDLIRHKLKFIEQKPTVACIKQIAPLVLAGNSLTELVNIAGGALITSGTLQEQNPDIVIMMLSGSTIEETMKQVDILLRLPGFMDIKAVKNNRFYIVDNSQYRLDTDEHKVEFIEALAELINPKQFIFGYEGKEWMKFSL